MNEEEIYKLQREVEDLKQIIINVRQHTERIPEWFAKNGKYEERTGVDSWNVWRFHPWLIELTYILNGKKSGMKSE
jgi:hypothetical protein